MPYIKQQDRDRLKYDLPVMWSPGELNYMLTKVIQYYWYGTPQTYQVANDIIGALEACKLEFYRRVVAKYEDRKIIENGDCY